METQPSVQSSFQKLNFDNNCEKTGKTREQIFEVLFKFTGFLYFVPNILQRIVESTASVSVFHHLGCDIKLLNVDVVGDLNKVKVVERVELISIRRMRREQ